MYRQHKCHQSINFDYAMPATKVNFLNRIVCKDKNNKKSVTTLAFVF